MKLPAQLTILPNTEIDIIRTQGMKNGRFSNGYHFNPSIWDEMYDERDVRDHYRGIFDFLHR